MYIVHVCVHVERSILLCFSIIFLGTNFQNNPFSGNVGVSTYQASDRFLVLAKAVVVIGHGEQCLAPPTIIIKTVSSS